MVSYPNKLFTGWCSNEGNTKSNILHYHIYTVRDIYTHDGELITEEITTLEKYFDIDNISKDDPYYLISATFKLNIPSGPIKISTTNHLKDAINIVEQITGNKVIEYEK